MGLYDQPNSWQCGPFALKHGLLAYGIFVHEDALACEAGSSEEHGTDDRQLMRIARNHGCVLQLERFHTALTARRALTHLLADHTPVLLCVDQWDHWVTAVGADETHVVVLDSHYDTVVRLEPWEAFMRRVGYRHRLWSWGPSVTWYDLHPLRTRGETGLRLALTTERARMLLAAPPTFRAALDDYARELLPFAARNGHRSGSFALGPWLVEGGHRHASALPPETLDTWAFAADLFQVRCEPDALRELVRSLERTQSRLPAQRAARPAPAAVPIAS
jgi:hypothetical protein